VLDLLLETTTAKLKPTSRFTLPSIAKEVIEAPAGSKNLTVAAMISALNEVLENSNDFSVVTDTGDCMYAGMSLQTDIFLAPGYYVSMGFGVPAAIGAQLAMPSRRPIVLVGDGAFQMTGMEISTAVKMGLNPIVTILICLVGTIQNWRRPWAATACKPLQQQTSKRL
jgi:thiamine pyrophosphate-dependent acetolactate synthase large subunit-like protein